MKKYLLLIALAFCVETVSAQFAFPTQSAVGGAMGGCSVALDDFWSRIGSVAGIARMDRPAVGLSFRNNFLLSELSYKSVAFALPVTKNGTIGTSYTHFGNADYNEQRVNLMYAQQFGHLFSLGAEFDYLHSGVSEAGYESANLFTFGVGLQFYPTNTLTVGVHIFNPISTHYQTEVKMDVPALFRAGVAYNFIKNATGTIEFIKDMNRDSDLRFGLEYTFFDFVNARIGFATQQLAYSFGVGIDRQSWGVDLAMQVHPTLGITPQISAIYKF